MWNITSKPSPWWHDKDLLPSRWSLADWARSNHSRGHGAITAEGIIARDVLAPCYLSAQLTSIATGQQLIDQILAAYSVADHSMYAPAPDHRLSKLSPGGPQSLQVLG